MKTFKPIVFLTIIILTFFLLSKINFKQDLIWNIKNLFHPKIVFQLKKVYILYIHDFKNKIIIEKNRETLITSSQGREFDFITFKNNFFKKNGPKVFLELHKDNKLEEFLNFYPEHQVVWEELQEKMGKNNLSNLACISVLLN